MRNLRRAIMSIACALILTVLVAGPAFAVSVHEDPDKAQLEYSGLDLFRY